MIPELKLVLDTVIKLLILHSNDPGFRTVIVVGIVAIAVAVVVACGCRGNKP